MTVSPLAPAAFPAMPEVAGVRLAAGACELRYRGRDDLVLVELAPGTAVAGVFTRSRTAAAPVLWCREALPGGRARAVVVNSGNANAFTGAYGAAGVRRSVAEAARLVGARPDEIFVASTGVIGETLADDRIIGALSGLHRSLSATAWEAAARAIMTTDTYPKGATRQVKIDDATVTVGGIAKGSGMIAPDMATTLAFVFTDATL